MARDNSKDITHQDMRARLSDKSKQTASSLKESASPKSSPAGPNLNNAEEILGAIYGLMVKNREQAVKTRELEQRLVKDKKKQDDTHHQEILKALTVRRKPSKVKKEKPKKEEPKKEAPKDQGTDKGAQAAKDKAAAEAKKKAEEEAKKKAEAEAKKKAEAEAKKKAEAEAKRKAEEEEKKKLAEQSKEAEKKRLAEEEKKKLAKEAEEAEKKRLAEEEKKRLAKEAKEAEKKRLAEQAKEAEKKRLAEEEKKRLAEEAERKKQTAEQVKEKPVEPTAKPAGQTKPVPETVKPPPSPPAATGTTAIKVVGGVAAATAASASMAAGPLAENIVAHESKTSSPKGGMKTKWKDDSEYNAYNKGTIKKKNKNGKLYDSIVSADFDEKGESVIDFSKMSIEEYLRRGSLNSGDPDKILAMGRYQIIPKTMKQIVEQLNLNPKTTFLNKDTQDYLFSAGLIGTKRKLVKKYIDGDPNVSRDQAIMQLAQEFASIGVPHDTKNDKGVEVKKGQSYYSQNSKTGFALNPPEAVGDALDAQRALNLKEKQKALSVPPTPNTGNQANQASIENQSLKDQAERNKAAGANINNQTTNVQTQNQSTPQTKADDSPPWYKKLFN